MELSQQSTQVDLVFYLASSKTTRPDWPEPDGPVGLIGPGQITQIFSGSYFRDPDRPKMRAIQASPSGRVKIDSFIYDPSITFFKKIHQINNQKLVDHFLSTPKFCFFQIIFHQTKNIQNLTSLIRMFDHR